MEYSVLMALLFGAAILAFALSGGGDDAANPDDGRADAAPDPGVGSVISGVEGNPIVEGTPGSNQIKGFDQDEYFTAYDGDDVIETGGGSAGVFAGGGNDRVVVEDGSVIDDAFVFGGDGADTLLGGSGDDEITGHGANSVSAFIGRSDGYFTDDGSPDLLVGGPGEDALYFGAGDAATGGADADLFNLIDLEAVFDADTAGIITDYETGDQIDVYGAAASADLSVVDDGEDALVQFQGRTVLVVEGAAGTLLAGDVTYLSNSSSVQPGYVETGEDADTVTGSDARDFIVTRGGNDTIDAGTGNDVIFAGYGDDDITLNGGVAHGGGGADTITGGDLADEIFTSGANGALAAVISGGEAVDDDQAADIVNAGGGADRVVFSGLDTVTGGAGNDEFVIDVDGVVSTGAPAVLTDYEAGEAVVLYADNGLGAVAVFDEGADAVVTVDGVPVLVAQGAAGVLTSVNVSG